MELGIPRSRRIGIPTRAAFDDIEMMLEKVLADE
jgi:hypothetical protein